jgi:hypothetical protein
VTLIKGVRLGPKRKKPASDGSGTETAVPDEL